jgi:uncharacterized membrane protein
MTIESWQLWALLSAVFAALTAIFAKVGVENIASDLATFIRPWSSLISFLILVLAPDSSQRLVRFQRGLGRFLFSLASEQEPPGCAISVRSSLGQLRWSRRSTS